MYVDGGEYPTINYTGTEDYFCGSYGFGNDILLKRYQTFSGLYAGLYAYTATTAARCTTASSGSCCTASTSRTRYTSAAHLK